MSIRAVWLTACVLSICIQLAPSIGAQAQGFRMVNGRNHPELDWVVAETEHFEIAYPTRLRGIEAEAAAVAEASYAALSANLGFTFEEKVRIYLSDEDEIANGTAVSLGSGFTTIWVHVNEFAQTWTGTVKWLRKVIAHEVTHLFHYRMTRSRIGLWARAFGDPMPSFWAEGLAQYETELWDAQRGDRWLRTAVLEDRLSYADGRSIWNGRLLYAIGNAQVRYFAEQYGDSTLARLLGYRTPVLFGLADVHDFGRAFQATTGQPYRAFHEEWKRHVNIYYNTMAGQMESLDSLHTEPLDLPGQYLYDVKYSPDTSRTAVLALASLDRPMRYLYVVENAPDGKSHTVAEGSIQAPVAWRPDGQALAYARRVRGLYGSWQNDLYLVDARGRHRRRLTQNRRASVPTFAPDGRRLAFVGVEDGTANVFVLDVESGAEEQATMFTGDVQITGLAWHPRRDVIAMAHFNAEGGRLVSLLDLETGVVTGVTDGVEDARDPAWDPTGSHLAVTLLKDDVPNVFVIRLSDGPVAGRTAGVGLGRFPAQGPSMRRVTALVNGGQVFDWLPADSAHAAGRLVVQATNVKARDFAYVVPADRTAPEPSISIPRAYVGWTTHRPPNEVPFHVAPDPALIQARYPYNNWSNLTHVLSGAVPYYNGPDDWGVMGGTSWIEPLGKHTLLLYGNLSLKQPRMKSSFVGQYINNQFTPTINVLGYRFPASARAYGGGLLLERLSGGYVAWFWPLDLTDAPYVYNRIGVRLRYGFIEPLNEDKVGELPDDLPPPEARHQADVQFSMLWRKRRPYRYHLIHPLDGFGVLAKAAIGTEVFSLDNGEEFVRLDVAAYRIFPGPGETRLFGYGRMESQLGTSRVQDFVGLSRYDPISVIPPWASTPVRFSTAERVRGYRRYTLGQHLAFGSLEYRVPLVRDLQTRLLGLIEFGYTSLAAFADGGVVWRTRNFTDPTRQLGVGLELKNLLSLAGVDVLHAVGIAQPATDLGDRDVDLYYRLRATIPF